MAPIYIDKFMGFKYITCISIVYMIYAIAIHIYFTCIIIDIILFHLIFSQIL